MRNRNRLSAAFTSVSAAVLAAMGAQAHAADGVQYKFSGYGTLAGTVTDQSDREFRSSMNQSKGVTDKLDLGADSRLGLQGVVDFGSGLTVVGQVLSQRHRVDGDVDSNRDFDIGLEWLFAQYSPTPNLDLRLGRVVLPAFMISDSRNVGYAQPWLRAPIDVYAQMPLSNLDGLQVNWRIPVGSAIITLQPSYGTAHSNISSGAAVIDADAKPVYSLNATLEWTDWLFRVGQMRGTTGIENLSLSPFLPALNYDMKDKFSNLGVQYDNGTALVMAEFAQRRQNDVPLLGRPLAETDSWYVAGGWRFGKWLPLIAYSETKDKLTDVKTNATSVSVRYDIISNVALKAQVSRYKALDSRAFVNPAQVNPLTGVADADYNDRITVFSFGVEFVF
jgi:hypothetical protein